MCTFDARNTCQNQINVSSKVRQGYPLTAAEPYPKLPQNLLSKGRMRRMKSLGLCSGLTRKQRGRFATTLSGKALMHSFLSGRRFILGAEENAEEPEDPYSYVTEAGYARPPYWKTYLDSRETVQNILEENDIDAVMYLEFFNVPPDDATAGEDIQMNYTGYTVWYPIYMGFPEIIEDIIIDDNIPDVEALVEFSVSAEQYQSQKKYLVLADNDVSAIEMSITPNIISEKAGANAIYATITRKEATNSKITVKISDTSNGELYYTNTITLDGGVTDATFPISIKDNKTVDGERNVKLYAEVYITSCNCTAIGNKQTQVEQDITILDDDGPTLFVSSNKSTILEGDDEGAVITVSRNTTNNAQPLVVQLSTEAADVSLAGTLTIPAGSSSATTTFKALSNQTEEGNRAITIKASANDFTPGTAWLLISDQSFPDLSLKSMETVSPSRSTARTLPTSAFVQVVSMTAVTGWEKAWLNGSALHRMPLLISSRSAFRSSLPISLFFLKITLPSAPTRSLTSSWPSIRSRIFSFLRTL